MTNFFETFGLISQEELEDVKFFYFEFQLAVEILYKFNIMLRYVYVTLCHW
jgi:hypothetical protein